MAARRLLIVMLVLLGISTLAAALAPSRHRSSTTTSTTAATTTATTATTTAPAPVPATGGLLRVTIDADSRKLQVVGTGKVRLHPGDEFVLTVRSRTLDQVEIPRLGQIEPVSPDTPASFDLLLDRPGSYDVQLVDAGRVVGRLEVTPRPARRGRPRG